MKRILTFLLALMLTATVGVKNVSAEVYVASIDGKEYKTLQEANGAVPSNNEEQVVIDLISDITIEDANTTIDINKNNVCVNGNNHIISAGDSSDWNIYRVDGSKQKYGSKQLIKVSGSIL